MVMQTFWVHARFCSLVTLEVHLIIIFVYVEVILLILTPSSVDVASRKRHDNQPQSIYSTSKTVR